MTVIVDIPFKNNDTIVNQQFQTPSRESVHPPQEKKAQQQIPALDGIRAIACIVVLAYHMSILARDYGILLPLRNINAVNDLLAFFGDFLAQFGESGVILFFVLSGFLLFLPYAKALLFDSPWPSPRRYYLRRIFRILPGYYAALLLLILFFHPEFLNPNHWYDLWTFITFNMSLNLSSQVDIPFWTLAVEFQFYLLLPIIAWLFSRIVPCGTLDWRIRKLGMCLLLLASWGVITRFWGLYMTNDQIGFSAALKPFIYGDTGKFLEVFAFGMFIATVYTYIRNTPSTKYWNIKVRQSNLRILGAGLALLTLLPLQHLTPLSYGGYDLTLSFVDPHISILVVEWMQWQVIGYSVGYGLCLLGLVSGSARLKRPFESSILRWLGSISFSFYMLHLPFMLLFVYVVVHNIHQQDWSPIVQYGLFWCWALVVIVPISAAFHHWVEKPGIRLGERLIAATQTWDKWFSVVTPQARPCLVDSWNEEETSTHTKQWQFQGQFLVKEIQSRNHQTPRQAQKLLYTDWDQINAQIPPTPPKALPADPQSAHPTRKARVFEMVGSCSTIQHTSPTNNPNKPS